MSEREDLEEMHEEVLSEINELRSKVRAYSALIDELEAEIESKEGWEYIYRTRLAALEGD